MDFTIRPATIADYPTLVAIGWRATADFGLSVADLEFADKVRTPATIAKRVVVVTANNQIIGAAHRRFVVPSVPTVMERQPKWWYNLPQGVSSGIN